MSITSGIGQRLFVNQYDLSGDVGSIQSSPKSRNQQDISVLQDPAVRRLSLLADGTLSFSSFFDVAAGAEHPVLSAMPQSALVSWLLSPVLGGAAASLTANTTSYQPERGQDGSLVVALDAQANATGIEWGFLLTSGKQTFASAAATTGVDDYVPVFGTLPNPSTFGLAAYLHVFSIGSGTATIHIQDSADNASYADLAGGSFADVSAAGSQRIATAATQSVRRYLRVNVSNTFTNLVAAVVVRRYITAFGL